MTYDVFNQPRYKISFLPFTAKKELERHNKTLPTHLKLIIEEVEPISKPQTPPFIPKNTSAEQEAELTEKLRQRAGKNVKASALADTELI